MVGNRTVQKTHDGWINLKGMYYCRTAIWRQFLKLESHRTLADEITKLYQIRGDAGSLEDYGAEQQHVADVFEHFNDARVQVEVGYIEPSFVNTMHIHHCVQLAIGIRVFKNSYEVDEKLRVRATHF